MSENPASGTALKWLESYLNNRKQVLSFHNHVSEELTINCGVPQGSILGPLLFLIYVNDLPNVSEKLFSVLFADDTNVFITGSNLLELANTLNMELKKLSSWLKINKLSLNIPKTHFMVFSNKHKQAHNINIEIDHEKVIECKNTTFLGILIDANLTWKPHIHNVCSKLAKCMGILSKAKHVLPRSAMVSLYYTLAYPYLMYCNEVWGCVQPSKLLKLNISQKKIIRIICNADYLDHTNNMFKELCILKFADINKYFI